MIDLKRFFSRQRRGLGWLPNPADDRDYDLEALALSRVSLPTHVSLRRNVPSVLKQGGVPSCVAHSVAGAITIRESIVHRQKPVVPSRLFLYFHARRMHDNPVKLTGTYLRMCFKAMAKIGVPDEEFWPYSLKPRIINRRPPWEAYMKGFARRDGAYHSILNYGAARVHDIKCALAGGFPVCFGTNVNRDFLNGKGPIIIGRPIGGLVGGHAMTIIGYKPGQGDETLFEVLNSWGPDWRDRGFAFLRESYITWARTRDLTIVHGWKGIS